MLVETQNASMDEMTSGQIVSERKILRGIVDQCRFETTEDVERYFEALTLLIWKHHLVGLIYACYYDKMANRRDGGIVLEGSDQTVRDTLALQAKVPDILPVFCEIHAVKNPDDGFRFGQVVYNDGSARGGVSLHGKGGDGVFEPYECLEMCECVVRRVEGKWRITEEWGVRSLQGLDRMLSGRPPSSGA